jgi:hypothetical protein
MGRRRDKRTLDLFDWQPPVTTERFREDQVRAASISARICRSVAVALKECEPPREEIAARMSEFLGEDVSKAMLDAYCSQAREDHNISAVRLFALAHATKDFRLLSIGPDLFGRSVVEDRYLPAMEEAMLAEKIEQLAKQKDVARRRWKGGLK